MKRLTAIVLLSFAMAACGGNPEKEQAENIVESDQAAGAIEANGENEAAVVEAEAENPAETVREAAENKADATLDAAENGAAR